MEKKEFSMKNLNKKIFLLGLVLLMTASMAFAAGGGEKGIKIGIVNLHPSESGYREANVKDMDRVFNAANGYNVRKANDNTLDAQLNAARQFITEGVEYLLISAADMNGWDSVLKAAKDAGVKVFLFDRRINTDPSNFEAALISDMEAEGKTAVDWMKTLNLPNYNIIHIQGQIGSAAQIGRSKPLDEAIRANANWKLVRRGTGGDTWSPDEAKKIVEAAIAAKEDFNVIYAENDGMAEGAMKALQAAGITHGVNGKVKIMGFDTNKFSLGMFLQETGIIAANAAPSMQK
jgi:simple sugar transport system substrate-binding protein